MALTKEQSLRQAISYENAQLAELARKQNDGRLMIDPDVLSSATLLPDLIDPDFLEPCQ